MRELKGMEQAYTCPYCLQEGYSQHTEEIIIDSTYTNLEVMLDWSCEDCQEQWQQRLKFTLVFISNEIDDDELDDE